MLWRNTNSKTFCISSLYMSSTLLAKLKVKPVPKQKSVVAVGLAKGEAAARQLVKVATKIVDKTGQTERDIGALRKRFARSSAVQDITQKGKEADQQVVDEAQRIREEIGTPLEAIKEQTSAPVDEPAPAVGEAAPLGDEAPQAAEMSEQKPEGEALPPRAEEMKKTAVAKVRKRRILKVAQKEKEEELKEEEKERRKTRVSEGPLTQLRIGDTLISDRLPEKSPEVLIRASSYYMSNREFFINFITSLFRKYKEQIDAESANVSCENRQVGEFTALAHQNLVRDYLNIYTPYRGLLLYHGLGSGKTCTSIGIAEGLKSHKRVLIMTPASLRANFYKELKKCGDPLFRKNQYWEFVKTGKNEDLIRMISRAISLPSGFIEKQGGAWLINVQKPGNYASLTAAQQRQLDQQLNEMIEAKYDFVNYNGLRESSLAKLTKNNTINPFDNKVIIIEEAHNFVGRIANKISRKETKSLSYALYQLLMSAQNARIVMLTGTPVVNYPNELGIMFNILRGYIRAFIFKLNILSERRINEAELMNILGPIATTDYIQYNPSNTTLTITRNPFGFVSVNKKGVYQGVSANERGEIDDDSFVKIVASTLLKNDIKVVGKTVVREYKALPDELTEFKNYFIDEDALGKSGSSSNLKNVVLFQRRILGLPSYFRSAQEKLLPRYSKAINFHVDLIPMSDYQFALYEAARKQERKLEERSRRKQRKDQKGSEVFEETVSTYRIFSRAFCNFVFPEAIPRPMPGKGLDVKGAIEAGADEDYMDAKSVDEREENPDGLFNAEDREEQAEIDKRLNRLAYEQNIKDTLRELEENRDKYLTPEALETYSPKFLAILENVKSKDNIGNNLIYSQFRTLEGIGVLKLVLETNGFVEFKIARNAAGVWDLAIKEEDLEAQKPMLALYTGTEEDEEKEIIRNVYNSEWQLIPRNIREKLVAAGYENNHMGQLIKVLMITASGAEGIDLKNVRYVHLTEPYWHPVRLEQVIGRAVRICSHADLPENLRTVDVYLYLMKLSEKQLSEKVSYDLRIKDRSKADNLTPFTSDQAIYEIASFKEEINQELLKAVKEASVDCVIHSKAGAKEGLKCFTFGNPSVDSFSTTPSISNDESDSIAAANKVKITWKAKTVTVQGVKYALREDTNELYDIDSLKANNPVKVGNLEKEGRRYKITWV